MHRTKPIKLIHNLHIFIGWTTYTQGDTLNQLFGTTKMENFMDELSLANSFFLWYYGTIGKASKKYLVHLMAASKGSLVRKKPTHPIIDFLKECQQWQQNTLSKNLGFCQIWKTVVLRSFQKGKLWYKVLCCFLKTLWNKIYLLVF